MMGVGWRYGLEMTQGNGYEGAGAAREGVVWAVRVAGPAQMAVETVHEACRKQREGDPAEACWRVLKHEFVHMLTYGCFASNGRRLLPCATVFLFSFLLPMAARPSRHQSQAWTTLPFALRLSAIS